MQQFDYKPKEIPYSQFYGAGAFFVITAYMFYGHAWFGIRNLTILKYPTSWYVFAGLTVLCAIIALYNIFSAHQSIKYAKPIIMNEDSFSFWNGTKGLVSVKFSDVSELWHKTDEDETSSIIYVWGERYQFVADNFNTPDEFRAFEKVLEKNCINITNR